MKRIFALLLMTVGLALCFVIGVGAEERTATFYNGSTVLEEVSITGDSMTLPAAISVGEKRFVGWTLVNGSEKTLYAAGSTISIPTTGDLRFEVCSIELRTLTGAAVSTDGTATLRFDGLLNLADYNALVALAGAENVSYGLLIAPYGSASGSSITHAADITGLLDRRAEDFMYTTSRYGIFGGRTESIPDAAILEKYTARAYLTVKIGGVDTTVYAVYHAVDHSRSVHGVSAAAFEDRASNSNSTYSQKTEAECYSRYTAAQLTLLKGRLDKVVCVGSITGTQVENKYSMDNFTFIAYHPDHYVSPYTVKEIRQNGSLVTYVVVAKEGADHNNVCAYFLEGSYRAPDRENEWKADGIYITVSNSAAQ